MTADHDGLHAVDTGRPGGPVVVFVGSLGSTTDMWAPQVQALGRQARCVLLDLPGHGGSARPHGALSVTGLAETVDRTLARLAVARAHVVGVSLGGMVALALAARHPDRVDRLAVVATSALLGPASAWHERAAAVRAGGAAAVASTVVGRWLSPDYAASHPDDVARFTAMITAVDAEGYAACCEAIATMDLRADLRHIAAPTLVVVGRDDPATPPDHAEAIAAAIPGARLELVAGAHLPTWESAGHVNALLAEHLLGPAGAGGDDGLRVRREVLGDAYVERALARTTALDADFQRWLTAAAWGGPWTRDDRLDRRTRSCVTIAVLTAQRATDELALHVRAGLRNGLSAEEIAEVIMHTAAYAGIPAANTAMAVLKQVVDGPQS